MVKITIRKIPHESVWVVRAWEGSKLVESTEETSLQAARDTGEAFRQTWARMHCQDCHHKDSQIEFVPSDGAPVDFICPECGSVNVFTLDD